MGWGMAIVFAVASALGYLGNKLSEKAEADELSRKMDAKRDRDIELMQLQFDTEKDNANKKANSEDKVTTLQEAILGNNANQTMGDIGMRQADNTLRYNQASIQNGLNTGNANAAIAAGGTRNSSALENVEMESDMMDMQLQHQEDVDRKQEALTLEGALNMLAEGGNNMQMRRDQVLDLRNMYEPGGAQRKLFDKRVANYNADVDDNIATVNKKAEWGANDWINQLIVAPVTGATQGYSFGVGVQDSYDKWKKVKFS